LLRSYYQRLLFYTEKSIENTSQSKLKMNKKYLVSLLKMENLEDVEEEKEVIMKEEEQIGLK